MWNNRIQKKLILFGVVIIGISSTLFALTPDTWPMNFNSLIAPPLKPSQCLHLGVDMYGFMNLGNAKGFNTGSQPVNVLQIWQPQQDALAMLNGFPQLSEQGQLRNILGIDDGVRGHFIVDGEYSIRGGALGACGYIKDNLALSIYVPFFQAQLKDVCWQNQTLSMTADDLRTQELLTDDFFANVALLGDGLRLQGWKRRGLGDVNLLFEWFQNYRQYKPLLKNVRLNGRVGFVLPTALKANEDLLLASSFGIDGALGVPFGGGMDLTFGQYCKAGFDVMLLYVFGHTRERRIKTSRDQTELLLLAKTMAYEHIGLTQQFNLYVQVGEVIRGLAFKFGYQYLKQGDNELTVFGNDYSTTIANTATNIEEWLAHRCILNLSYNFAGMLCDDYKVDPYISLFASVPFNGRRAVMTPIIGLVASVSF